jgi:hypothetical protein
VTQRLVEVPTLWLKGLDFVQELDFIDDTSTRKTLPTCVARQKFNHYVVSKFIQFGFLARANTDHDLKSIKPWVIEIRGHYSYFRINDSELNKMMILMGMVKPREGKMDCAIHYRLGDLLHLTTKSFIKPQRIKIVLEEHFQNCTSADVFSDASGQKIKNLLLPSISHINLTFFNVSPIETIRSCVQSEGFIGTNSKLTLWIAMFRTYINSNTTAIPYELVHHFDKGFGFPPKAAKLVVY